MRKFIVQSLIVFVFGIIISIPIYDFIIEFEEVYLLKLKKGIKNNSNINVMFFGSSVDGYTDSLDIIKTSISQRIHEKTGLKVSGISRGANNNRLHELFISFINKNNNNSNLKYLIIPINLRSYSPEWDLRPEYELKKLHIYFDKKTVFYQNKNNEYTTYNYKVRFKDTLIGYQGQQNFRGEVNKNLRDDFIFKYLFELKNSNNTSESLKRIRNIETNSVKKIFYITPIDYETGNILINGFDNYLNKNIDKLKSILDNQIVIDLSKSLTSKNFSYPKFNSTLKENYLRGSVNEHLNEFGKEFVADTLSKVIVKFEKIYDEF